MRAGGAERAAASRVGVQVRVVGFKLLPQVDECPPFGGKTLTRLSLNEIIAMDAR